MARWLHPFGDVGSPLGFCVLYTQVEKALQQILCWFCPGCHLKLVYFLCNPQCVGVGFFPFLPTCASCNSQKKKELGNTMLCCPKKTWPVVVFVVTCHQDHMPFSQYWTHSPMVLFVGFSSTFWAIHGLVGLSSMNN